MQLNAFSGQTSVEREDARKLRRKKLLDEAMHSSDVSMPDVCMIALRSAITDRDLAMLASQYGYTPAEMRELMDRATEHLKQRVLDQFFASWLES